MKYSEYALPTTEWVTVDDDGEAYLDPDGARAEMIGCAFETWVSRGQFDREQMRALYLVKHYMADNASEIARTRAVRLDMSPLADGENYQRAMAAFGSVEALNGVLAGLNDVVFASLEVNGG